MRNATVQRLTRDSPILAFFSAACLLACALAAFVAAPQWSAYKERSERVKHYDSYIVSSDGFEAMRLQLESKNELLRDKLGAVSAEMPPHGLSDMLQELIRHGEQSGIALSKIQPEAAASAGHTPVFLETKADYHKLGKYITLLETSPQIFQIRKVAVETARDGELIVKLLVNCRVSAEGGVN